MESVSSIPDNCYGFDSEEKVDEMPLVDSLELATENLCAYSSNEPHHVDNSFEETQKDSHQTEEIIHETTPTIPLYNFNQFSFLTKCSNVFRDSDCLRGCKWAPDGTCILTNCEDRTLRLLDLPRDVYDRKSWSDKSLLDLSPSLEVQQCGLVYDFDWYPFMSSWDQATACFISTSTDCPVHLFDAFTGHIRASYRGFDQYDELTHAFCVAFSSTGTSIFCGYRNNIKIFDVSKPGRECDNINTKQVGKQKGIISCISDNPEMPKVFAAGSYNKTIGLYTVDGSSLCQLIGHGGGLTQIKFSSDGIRLYSAARKDSEIICWDLRHPGKTLFSLQRPHSTNQRIYFDLSSDDKYLISGSTDGRVRIWNVFDAFDSNNLPNYEFEPHKDCTNGISLHRQLPIVATCSGQWHIDYYISDDDSTTSTEKSNAALDNSVKLWWIGETECADSELHPNSECVHSTPI